MGNPYNFAEQGPVLEQDQIDSLEAAMGVTFPQHLVEFWRRYGNGGEPERPVLYTVPSLETDSDLQLYYGIGHSCIHYDLRNSWEDIREYFPAQMVPFARDSMGSQLCVMLGRSAPPTVFFWDWCFDGDRASLENCHWVADSLDDFMMSLEFQDDYDDD